VTGGIGVVALVTSTGGLEALSVILRGLPPDLPAPVVVQQHLGKNSVLPAILEQRLQRHVAWAQHGARLTSGAIVVCPPHMWLQVLPDATCALHESQLLAGALPHDALLRSLAESYGARALAVVLTGLGRDGAVGTAALRAAGGVVLAQSEETSEQSSMPRAAAKAGADMVLPLLEIADVVTELVRGVPGRRTGNSAVQGL
jgi:chemotaxis response regulator CheB